MIWFSIRVLIWYFQSTVIDIRNCFIVLLQIGNFLCKFKPKTEPGLLYFVVRNTGNTAAEIPVFGIDFNTGIPVLGIGIGSFILDSSVKSW